jgi:hypothetical protein
VSHAQAQPAAPSTPLVAQPAPPTAAATVALPPVADVAQPAPAPARKDTPSQLRLLSLGVVVVGLVTGLVGALALSTLAYSLYRAQADTAQLVRVQQIQTNLLVADATATNAFLVGGLEREAQRAQYDAALTRTGSLITEAARAQPADAVVLARLNQQVLAYAGAIEQARANNRQGLPVGAQYLRSASAELRTESLPILDVLVRTNADRATTRMAVWPGWVFLGVGILALAALVLAQVWLARRFRRTLNRGMLAATIVLLAALVISGVALSQLGTAVRSIQDGSFSDVNAAAEARIEASDAKSNESLTLVARGSGAAFEEAWATSADRVDFDLGRLGADAPTEEWNRYRQVHAEIRALDDNGNWDGAVALATGTGERSANSAFNAFDTAMADTLDQADREATEQLSARQPGLVIGAVLALLAGLAVALLGRRGVAARLREYR